MNLVKITNFGQLFIEAMNNYGQRTVLQWKEDEEYKSLKGQDFKEYVYNAAITIGKLNLKQGDKCAIISESRYEWVVTDFACIFNGIVTVPVYTTMTSEQIGYILRHSESKLCFVSNKMLLEKVLSVRESLPDLKQIICYNKIKKPDNIINFSEFLKTREKAPLTEYFLKKAEAINENNLLTIIYTSGTMGVPKGVCLTHKNILSNLKSCHKAFRVDANDVFLSFLPLAHCYERTAGYYFPLSAGAKIVYAQNIDTLSTQIEEIRPTLITAVPLLFSKIQRNIQKAIERYSFFKALFKIIAFKKLKKKLGGRLRFFVSGGSALNKKTGEFFDSARVKILEGYGMTEASPVISANREDNYEFGTVGIPLDGVTVKIADDYEILVRGDNVMQRYYKDDEETKRTIIDGWLHTGDIGEFDEEGRLKITDRKKALYKTSGGKYVSLTNIEDTINRSKYISQVIVFGGDRMFVSALIVPDLEELKTYAERNKIKDTANEVLTDNPQIIKFIEKEIERHQNGLAKYERVRKFTLLAKPFSIESGELTPTLKIKRKVIEEKYKDQIEKMYDFR